MKEKVLKNLQAFSKGIFVPVLILPIVGILFAFASIFTNSRVYNTIPFLNHPFFINFGKILGQSLIPIIGTYLGILFAVGIAIGMAKKEKHYAALVAMLSYFVFIHSMNIYMGIMGLLLPADQLRGSGHTMVMGVQIIDMGIFLGILLGLIVAYIHNKFIDVELKGALQIYGGSRLVFVILSLIMIVLSIFFTHTWPIVQHGINLLAHFIEKAGAFGVFVYGFLERILIPTGLHHLVYTPFLYTNIGGTQVVDVIQNGETVPMMFEGARNIYNAQLSNIDAVTRLTKSVVWDARGITKIFGLVGAALAMYHTSKPKNKTKIKVILLSAMGASILAGVTEPIEFSFLFTAPILFVIHAILSGLGMVAFSILDVRSIIPNGVIDFILINIPVGIDRTSWPVVIVIGIIQAILYYVIFKYLILKFNLKTPGREDNKEVKLYTKKDYGEKKKIEKETDENIAELIVRGLGGKENILKVENCYTRLRVNVKDMQKVNDDILNMTNPNSIIKVDDENIQIVYGIKVRGIRNQVDNYLNN